MSRIRPVFILVLLLFASHKLIAQNTAPATPRAELTTAPLIRFTGNVDSNSPAIWQRINGLNQMLVLTSTAGQPSLASGPQLRRLSDPAPIVMNPWPGGGIWMEAVVADDDGTLYGYYHNEMGATMCRGDSRTKVIPRIGAARSRDRGATWEPLGLVLEAPPGSFDCKTNNMYFVGGVGDFSVRLDPDSRDLYFFYSQYIRFDRLQGVGVARLAWADRDNPTGKIMVWNTRTWLPVRITALSDGTTRAAYPPAVPIFPALEPWHDDDEDVDAFWGPSVHWNTYLEQYVMLLNHAKNDAWSQEGIYVSFAPRLDDPTLWTKPVKILDGGVWYPQVMGLEDGSGTDKVAGRWARFFMGGVSEYLIQFIK
ncbi:MAG TPA: hypothetical protein VKB50_04930 [Vicinamibacterales bacterium]|nr:hypothetical protein [Vicinamibacterales bacterium]